MNDPISMINQQHPSVLPYLMLASLLLSIVAPFIAARWPKLAGPLDAVLSLLSSVPGRTVATHMAAKRPPRPPSVLASTLLMTMALACCGCGASPKQIAQDAGTVLDIANATCSEIDPQSSADWIELTCEAIGAVDGISKVFRARVRRIDAVALASRSCPEASK
jgi:hypothetical protein